MQQGQRHDFTGIQFGLGVLRNVAHFLVHRVEQCDNKIWGSHRLGSSWLKSVQPQLEPSRDYLSTRTLVLLIKLTPLVSNLDSTVVLVGLRAHCAIMPSGVHLKYCLGLPVDEEGGRGLLDRN